MAKIYNERSDTLITGTNGNDSIENYYGSSVTIYGGAGNDSIYNHGANNSTVNNVIDGGIGNDYIVTDGYPNYGATVKGGEGNDTIQSYDYHSVLDGGAGDDYLSLRDDSNSERLIKYRAGDGNDTISGLSDMDTVEIAATAYSSVRSGNNIIVNVGDGSLTFVNAVNRSVYIELVNDTTSGGGSDTQEGGGTDTTPGGGDDTQEGGDDTAGKIITNKTSKTSLVGTAYDDAFYNHSSTVTIKGGDGSDYLGTLRKTSNVKLYGEDGDDTLEAYNASKALLNGGDGNDDIYSHGKQNTILGGAGKNTLYGGDGYDYIVGGKLADSLFGDGDDDTLWGQAGNDTLTGGDGNDLFVFSAGKDVITDYTSGEDALQVTGTYTSSIKGSDVILRFGSSTKTLTLKDAKYKEILFIDGDGNESTAVFGATIVKTKNYAAKETDEYLDASARKGSSSITGNDLNNMILGSTAYKNTINGGDGFDYIVGGNAADKLYGEDGNDTLWGGKGNDTLYGGDGADTFLYSPGDGKDVIYDFDEDDMLQIDGTVTGTYYAGSNAVVFKVNGSSSNTITLKEYATDTFNVNGDFYTIQGSRVVKQ